MKKETKYVMHFCKNKKCNSGWLDEDLTNAKTRPPKWKYCDKCCAKYGYENTPLPPKKILSKKQKQTIEENKFCMRKKTPESNEKDNMGIKRGES